MSLILTSMCILPLLASVLILILPPVIGKSLSLISSAITLILTVTLVSHGGVVESLYGWLRVDSLSLVFILTVSLLYFLTVLFSIGYVRESRNRWTNTKYAKIFFSGINFFCWAMLMAPSVSSLALVWVAIEITTVISALLVALDDTDGASEAAWKYVLIASMGLGIALFATILLYYAGASVLGNTYDLYFPQLLTVAHKLSPVIVRLAFVLAVVGFGTKVGFVPVHTWLPDAHSEAPTPVSTLLSGALLAVSFYAIMRYFQVAIVATGPAFPRNVLLAFGLASLALAALYLASQRDLKRLLAYSSIEHMGILAIGMSFSAPIAVIGVLLHVLAHALAKGSAFFGAGTLVKKFGTKNINRIRAGVSRLPVSGPLFVLSILALSAFPPFGIFRSEFLIVLGGFKSNASFVTIVLVLLITVAFLGFSRHGNQVMFSPPLEGGDVTKGEVSYWMTTAMVLALLGLVVLGIHPPQQVSTLLTAAARELSVKR